MTLKRIQTFHYDDNRLVRQNPVPTLSPMHPDSIPFTYGCVYTVANVASISAFGVLKFQNSQKSMDVFFILFGSLWPAWTVCLVFAESELPGMPQHVRALLITVSTLPTSPTEPSDSFWVHFLQLSHSTIKTGTLCANGAPPL